MLCSPLTLFAVLAVIRQAVDTFRLERTSDEILDLPRGFTKQWEQFSDQVDKLGRTFDSTQRAYDELSGTRRRALQRPLDQIDDLRTRPRSTRPRHRGAAPCGAPRDDVLFESTTATTTGCPAAPSPRRQRSDRRRNRPGSGPFSP